MIKGYANLEWLVSGQYAASRNTRGRKTIDHKTTESNYHMVKLPHGQNTRGLGNQVTYHVKYDYYFFLIP